MTNDDFPCCASGAHEATTNSELRVANAEIARLRAVIVEVKDCTRYTLNSRWALNRISRVIIRDSVTGAGR